MFQLLTFHFPVFFLGFFFSPPPPFSPSSFLSQIPFIAGLLANFSGFQTLLNVSTEEVSVMKNLLDSALVRLELLQKIANTTAQRVASAVNLANQETAEITSINANMTTIAGTLSSNATHSLAFLDTANKVTSLPYKLFPVLYRVSHNERNSTTVGIWNTQH